MGVKDEPARFHVVAYDYGIKQNILRKLRGEGCSSRMESFCRTDPAIPSHALTLWITFGGSWGDSRFSGFAWGIS